ncbi:MAG: AAA family ATPase [Anaerolineales bacterium]
MSNHITSVTFQPEKFPTADHYPFNLPIFHETRQLVFDTPITLFVGENGTGKSTLLEALAWASGIYIWRKQEGVRYQVNQYEKQLYKYLSLEWSNGRVPGAYFGSEIFNDFRSILDEWAASDPGQLKYFGGASLMTQSHGQSMMSYFRARYQIKGLYFLDEPETALSPRSQLALLDILEENAQAGHAQFIIATHSPILLACKVAKIFSFDGASVRTIAYQETDHYQLYKRFLLER